MEFKNGIYIPFYSNKIHYITVYSTIFFHIPLYFTLVVQTIPLYHSITYTSVCELGEALPCNSGNMISPVSADPERAQATDVFLALLVPFRASEH